MNGTSNLDECVEVIGDEGGRYLPPATAPGLRGPVATARPACVLDRGDLKQVRDTLHDIHDAAAKTYQGGADVRELANGIDHGVAAILGILSLSERSGE